MFYTVLRKRIYFLPRNILFPLTSLHNHFIWDLIYSTKVLPVCITSQTTAHYFLQLPLLSCFVIFTTAGLEKLCVLGVSWKGIR